jgi:hypothetical protein
VTAGKASGRVTPEGETARAPDLAVAAKIGRTATTSRPARQLKPFAVDRAVLKPPPPDPFELGRIGSLWSILKFSDATRKRAWARCLACSAIREVNLVGDTPPSCGCAGSRSITSRSAFAEVVFVPGLRGRARS